MHIETSSLIIAGAGSGKTRALTYKIAYLIFDKKINPQQILAVTFTNKAANEMKERLLKLWEEMTSLSKAQDWTKNISYNNNETSWDDVLDFLETIEQNSNQTININDLKRIWTFHGIFLKILKEEMENALPILSQEFSHTKYNKNFTILDPNDTASIIKDIIKKFNLKEEVNPNECKWIISKQKNLWLSPQKYMKWEWLSSDYNNRMWKIYGEYQKQLSISNALDFDDLLLFPYLIFSKSSEILQKRVSKFKYIMVDEAQDTNRIQFELMKMLSGTNWNITLIWDDYQSIYGRRWAIMENFLNVKRYWQDIKMFKLQTNYRSKPHIVHAWSHIIKNNKNQYEKNIQAHRKWNDKITVFSNRDEIDEAANIIDLIRKMKWEKIQSWSEVAILYRTNAQSSSFEQILVQEWIPYKIWWAFKFFERKEIKDVISYLVYILNSNSSVSLKRIINVPNRKIWKTTISNLEDVAVINNISLDETMQNFETLWVRLTTIARTWIFNFYKVIHSIKHNFDSLTPADVIETIVRATNFKDYLIKEEWSETKWLERYENIWQLINMAEKYDWTWESALRQFMDEVSLLTDNIKNEDWDLDAIKLMSLHSSKGLEFPIVFIVGLEEQVLPLASAIMEPHLMEEERRLMYVGITRAENHLFLSYANCRMQWGQTRMNPPSRFISELPEDLLKKYDLWGGSRWYGTAKPIRNFEAEDSVKHKLFGTGVVLETWTDMAIVKFDNEKFGVRKVEMRFLNYS